MLAPQRLQRPHPPFVARAPRLDAPADPRFFFGELLVELRRGANLDIEQLVLCAGSRRSRQERSEPARSSSTIRVASRLRKVRSWVMKISAARLNKYFSSQVIAPISRWLVGSSSTIDQVRSPARASITCRRVPPEH
jgi:hypothetical protein